MHKLIYLIYINKSAGGVSLQSVCHRFIATTIRPILNSQHCLHYLLSICQVVNKLPRFAKTNRLKYNNNKQTFQNAKLTLKSRTGARGGYNQKHANRQTKKSSATVWSAAVRCLGLAAQEEENSRMTGRNMKMPVAQERITILKDSFCLLCLSYFALFQYSLFMNLHVYVIYCLIQPIGYILQQMIYIDCPWL